MLPYDWKERVERAVMNNTERRCADTDLTEKEGE